MHVFKLDYVSVQGRFLKLLRVKSCFGRQFRVFFAALLQVRIHAMMTSWEGFGCSEVVEADLNDSFRFSIVLEESFTFLSWFMVVFREGFGSS